MKILIAYPNLPLMFSPAISVGIFTAIAKEQDCEVDIFETTYYTNQFMNRHIEMSNVGANNGGYEDSKKILTTRDPKNVIPDFKEKVESFKPDLILMSLTENVYAQGIEMLESIREKNIPNIVGGVFARDGKRFLLKHDVVDQICHHEGEGVVRDAIQRLKENKPLHDIPGTTYRFDDHAHVNPEQELCNLSEIMPDFSLFDQNRWIRPMGGRSFRTTIPMETYRGCPYNCTYCNSPSQRAFSKENNQGNFMRRKSADVIEKELQHYLELYSPELILFIDDSFLARPKKELEEFSNMWSKYKVPFWMNTRVENCSPEVLDMMKHAGIYRMTFGLESGNEQYRKEVLSRNVKQEVYHEYFEYINESDIPYSLNAIIGMPYETPSMIEDTARLVHRARGYDGVTISTFVPYVGTGLRTMAENAGFVDKDFTDDLEGGLLGNYVLNMPKPYVQSNEVYDYQKIFSLLAFFDESRWDEIKASLNDKTKYQQLLDEYKSLHWSKYQEGGKTRIKRIDKKIKSKYTEPSGIKAWSKGCAKHDESSSFRFEVMAAAS